MVDNEILQIVVFSIFFGVACAAMGERAKLVLEGIEGLSHIILRVTGYVMKLAPLAVFCAMAATISTNGLGILVNYAKFMGEFYFGLACLWVVLIVVGFIFLGPSVKRLILLVREPFLLAFSTASSEAAYPKMLEQLAKFPISRNISSFVLPLGYSFNLDGTMMYCTFASVFIAQAYDIPLTLRHADRHAADPDADQQGRCRRAARLPGGDRGDAQPVQPAGGRTAADPRHRHVPRHGPLGHQRHRQLAGDRGGRQVGGPADQRCRHAGDDRGDGSGARMRRPARARPAGVGVACGVRQRLAEEGAPLTGTLKTIHDRGTILIGYRDSALPFSFLNKAGQPVGFSLDICHGIAEDVARTSEQRPAGA